MPILLCDYYTIFSVVYIQNVTTTLKSVFSEKIVEHQVWLFLLLAIKQKFDNCIRHGTW